MIKFEGLQNIQSEQPISREINPKSILSEQIFGPIKQGYCSCGIPFLKSANETVCTKCGVENVSVQERSIRFAKIESPIQFCTVTELNDLTANVKGFRAWYKYPTKQRYYLHLDVAFNKYSILATRDGCIIDIPLTGLYMLWFVGAMIEMLYHSQLPPLTEYFGCNLLVTPPNSRPSIIANGTVKFTHDLDCTYNGFISTVQYVKQRRGNLDASRYIVLVLGCIFPKLSTINIDWLDVNTTACQMMTIINEYLLEIDENIDPITSYHIHIGDLNLIESYPTLFSQSDPEVCEIALISIKLANQFFNKTGKTILDKTVISKDASGVNAYVSSIVLPEMKSINSIQSLVQKQSDAVFNCMITLLSGKKGMIRNQFLGKGIDFSARAVISSNMFIKPYEAHIPKHMFIKLFFIEYLSFIYNHSSTQDELTPSRLEKLIANSDNVKEDDLIDKFIEYFFDSDRFGVVDKLVLINRQPTLWRYGIPAIQITDISNGNTIELNPLMLDPLNADYDGDTCAIYRVHDYTAKVELYENAYVMNTVRYDHNNKFLHTLKDESYFMLKSFTDCGEPFCPDQEYIEIATLDELGLDMNNVQQSSTLIIFNDIVYNVGTCLVNLAAGFKSVVIEQDISRENVSYEIFKDSNSNIEYFNRLHNLSIFLNIYGFTIPDQTITIPFQECVDINNLSKDSILLNKLPTHPTLGYLIHKSESDKIIRLLKETASLHRFRQTKFGRTQFARSLVSIGYIANHINISSGTPISSSTFGGLTPNEFFNTSFGTRKGIMDKQKVTPESGYLGRSMAMNLSPISIGEIDCGVEYGFEITIKNDRHAKSIVKRYYKFNQTDPNWILLETVRDTLTLVGQRIVLRSPILCKTDGLRICKHCFGEYNDIPSKYVGVITGCYVVERITQLSMRTFHDSGSATYHFTKDLLDFVSQHLVDITNNLFRFTLVFEIPVPQILVKEMVSSFTEKGEDYIDHVVIKSNGKELEFSECNSYENQDVTKVLKQINGNLKVKHKVGFADIENTYGSQIRSMLSLGDIYSIFVEITMCNSYTAVDSNIPVRYTIKETNKIPDLISRKNIQMLHQMSSNILSLLYLPNKNTIMQMSGFNKESEVPSVFEQIWSGDL